METSWGDAILSLLIGTRHSDLDWLSEFRILLYRETYPAWISLSRATLFR